MRFLMPVSASVVDIFWSFSLSMWSSLVRASTRLKALSSASFREQTSSMSTAMPISDTTTFCMFSGVNCVKVWPVEKKNSVYPSMITAATVPPP